MSFRAESRNFGAESRNLKEKRDVSTSLDMTSLDIFKCMQGNRLFIINANFKNNKG